MTARTRILSAGTAALVAGALGLIPAAAANAAPAGSAIPAAAAAAQPAATTLPVTGTLADGSTFTGSLSNLTSSVVNGALQLTGTITGSTTSPTGVVTPVTDTFTATIDNVGASGSCSILDLDLGPLHLDLLGLVIDLAPVHLDVTAVPGAGNLLGNLLCAVAGLLDGNGALTSVSALLNRLLTGLGL